MIKETQIERQYPPKTLLIDTVIPSFNGGDYGDFVQFAADLRTAIEQCNADKQAIRKWSEIETLETEPDESSWWKVW